MIDSKTFELMNKDEFIHYCGIELTEVGNGEATSRMVVKPTHLNGLGSVQGGALFTLADFTAAAAANSREKHAVSLDGSIDFIKGVSHGTLTAHATETSLKRTIASYNVEIHDEDNNLIATFHAKVYRLDPK